MTSDFLYRLDISYLGGDFHGWQSQPSGRGIQNHMERALSVLLRHDIKVLAASRTDTGVHAEHQVCTFRSSAVFDEHRWTMGLNGLLPESVRVFRVSQIEDEFHPIKSSCAKAYRYRIWVSRVENPFFARMSWRVHGPLDVAAMTAASESMTGELDFTSFCAADSNAKTKVRRVLEIKLDRRGNLINVWVLGEGFLKQMVRNMVGALVEVGAGNLPAAAIPSILAARDRKAAPRTAPAQGLTLVKIFYEEPKTIESLISEASVGYTQSIVT